MRGKTFICWAAIVRDIKKLFGIDPQLLRKPERPRDPKAETSGCNLSLIGPRTPARQPKTRPVDVR